MPTSWDDNYAVGRNIVDCFIYISHFPFFLYFSIQSYFLLANYKYLARGGVEGGLLSSPLSTSQRKGRKEFSSTRYILSSSIFQLQNISWNIFTLCLKCRRTIPTLDYPFASPMCHQRVGCRSESLHFYSVNELMNLRIYDDKMNEL